MAQDNTDEIDLGIVFTKIKNTTNKFLISIYHGTQFLIKHWWKLLILVIIGGTIGHFSNKNSEPNKETELIVQNNFKSSNYVYNAIYQLNNKLKEKDTVFLKNAGFKTDTIVIKKIEIEPIVNMIDLLNKSRDYYKPLETFIDQVSIEDEILTSELFLSEYTFHKIHINTSANGTQEVIENVLNFLNDNIVFNDIKKVVFEETKVQINHYKESINKIDKILESQSGKNLEDNSSNQLIIPNGADFTDFYELINSKNNAIYQIISLETELTKYDNVVTLINKPVLISPKDRFSNKTIIYPFILVFLYIFFFLMKDFYYKLKTISESADNNK